MNTQPRAGLERRIRRADASTVALATATNKVVEGFGSSILRDRLPSRCMIIKHRQTRKSGRGSQNTDILWLANYRHLQRWRRGDARHPEFPETVAVDPATAHSRLRKLTVLHAVVPAPCSHGLIALVGEAITDLLMGKQGGKGNPGVKFGQLFHHLAMGNKDI